MGHRREKAPELEKDFSRAADCFPKRKDEMFQEIGEALLENVQRGMRENIHSSGRLINGQEYHKGERHGYVSLHPKYEKGGGRNSIRPVTTFLNNGTIQKYTVREKWHVAPAHFYQKTERDADAIAEKAARKMEEKLKDDLS